jgi:UDP-N-acetylmuramate dehydrogenase
MNLFKDFEQVVRLDEPLGMHTWFHLGGPAEYFADPRTPEEFAALVRRAREENVTVHMLGAGSNVLVRDEGVSGLVIRLLAPAFADIQVEGNALRVGAGAKLSHVVTSASHAGLAGIEQLVGVPGTFGGALCGNTGTSSTSVGEWIESIRVMTDKGEIAAQTHDELIFAYRESGLDQSIIVDATLRLEEDDPRELARRMQKQWIMRRTSQPLGHQCAGVIFKDPLGMRAGRIISDAGLKGTRIGGAIVSERRANFIVAEPECTSSDVLRLIDLVRDQVRERQEVELELALNIW